jgi:hypothetical protein
MYKRCTRHAFFFFSVYTRAKISKRAGKCMCAMTLRGPKHRQESTNEHSFLMFNFRAATYLQRSSAYSALLPRTRYSGSISMEGSSTESTVVASCMQQFPPALDTHGCMLPPAPHHSWMAIATECQNLTCHLSVAGNAVPA